MRVPISSGCPNTKKNHGKIQTVGKMNIYYREVFNHSKKIGYINKLDVLVSYKLRVIFSNFLFSTKTK